MPYIFLAIFQHYNIRSEIQYKDARNYGYAKTQQRSDKNIFSQFPVSRVPQITKAKDRFCSYQKAYRLPMPQNDKQKNQQSLQHADITSGIRQRFLIIEIYHFRPVGQHHLNSYATNRSEKKECSQVDPEIGVLSPCADWKYRSEKETPQDGYT